MKNLVLVSLVAFGLVACSSKDEPIPPTPDTTVPENCVTIDPNDTDARPDIVSNGIAYKCEQKEETEVVETTEVAPTENSQEVVENK